MGNGDFISQVIIDTQPAEIALGDLKIKLGSFASEAVSAFGIARGALNALEQAFAPVIQFTQESIAAANEAERTERKLAAALQQRGQLTDTAIAELSLFNSTLERTVGIEDDQLASIQAQLVAMGIYRGDLQKATLAVVGLSERTGTGLEPATRAVAKAILGNTDALKKFGVQGSDTATVINELAAQHELAAAQQGTLEFATNQVSLAYGNLQERVGGLITQSPTVVRETEGVAKAIRGLDRAIGAASTALGREGIGSSITTAVRGLASAIPGFSTITGIVENFSGALQRADDALADIAPKLESATTGGLATPSRIEDVLAGNRKLEAEFDRYDRDNDARNKRAAQEQQRALEESIRVDEARRRRQGRAIEDEQRQQRERARGREAAEKVLAQIRSGAIDAERRDREDTEQRRAAYLAKEDIFYQQLTDVAQTGVVGFLSNTLAGIAAGQNVLDAIGQFFGQMLVQTGTQLIQLGVAAEVAGLLSVIPFLVPFVGPPGVSTAAGAAAIAAGIAMVALGSAIGGSGGGGGSASGRSGAGGGGGRQSARDVDDDEVDNVARQQRFSERARDKARDRRARARAAAGDEPSSLTYNVYFTGRALVTEREAGRVVNQLGRRGDELAGRRRRGN